MKSIDWGPLASGRAFADLTSWRKVAVRGEDARDWLNGLISADISDLLPGEARRSLLLSPTGRVRAEFTVAAREQGFLLIQDPTQPRSIEGLLSPYVLSADVTIQDRSDACGLFAFPGQRDPPDTAGSVSIPSCLGAGLDVLSTAADHDSFLKAWRSSHQLATAEEVEAWRVWMGLPRFGLDALEDDLPQEAGFDDAVAFDKGCYLGQEAVARVRNLGHPRRMVMSLSSREPVSSGEPVYGDGQEVGRVTSAVANPDGSVLLARVRWDARDVPLRTASGAALENQARPVQPSRPV